MQRQSANPALPLWLLILIVGTIVGVSMGRAQSMGLYLPPVTKALDIGREPFGLAMALTQLTMGLGAPFSGGLIDKFGAGPDRRHLRARRHRRALPDVCGQLRHDLLISGVLMGIGVSGTGITSLVGTIGRLAPPEKRLSAIASIGMAAGIGGFVALPVMHLLIELVGWKAEPDLADGDHGAADPARLADRRQARPAGGAGARPDADGGACARPSSIQASGC